MPSLPTFQLPFDLPNVSLPAVDLPTLDLPTLDVLAIARDAAYAGTGLVALTAERVGQLHAAFTATVTEAVKARAADVAALAEPVVATVKAAVTR